MIVIERPRAWRGLRWVIGLFGGVFGCNTRKAYAVTRLTVGVSSELQMAQNLTSGLPVVYQGHLANLGPFRERLTPLTKRDKRGAPVQVGVSDCKTDNGENARTHETNMYANEMHMMTWYEVHDTQAMTRQQQRILEDT